MAVEVSMISNKSASFVGNSFDNFDSIGKVEERKVVDNIDTIYNLNRINCYRNRKESTFSASVSRPTIRSVNFTKYSRTKIS